MTVPHELTSPSGAATTVVFWDIDGTLLSTGGAGRIAWVQAAADVWGRDLDPQLVRTAGLTDVEIAVDIARHLSGEPGVLQDRDEAVRALLELLHGARRVPRRGEGKG